VWILYYLDVTASSSGVFNMYGYLKFPSHVYHSLMPHTQFIHFNRGLSLALKQAIHWLYIDYRLLTFPYPQPP